MWSNDFHLWHDTISLKGSLYVLKKINLSVYGRVLKKREYDIFWSFKIYVGITGNSKVKVNWKVPRRKIKWGWKRGIAIQIKFSHNVYEILLSKYVIWKVKDLGKIIYYKFTVLIWENRVYWGCWGSREEFFSHYRKWIWKSYPI